MLPGYSHEVVLRVTAPPGQALPSGTVVRVALETKDLIASGICRPDRRDFRLAYAGTEINRIFVSTSIFLFRLQAEVPAGTTTTDYVVNHGNPTEVSAPLQSPRSVWPFYVDGDDLASLTLTGDAAATDIPRPGFLKFGINPTLTRTPASGDYKNIREVELYYEAGTFWATYDADDHGDVDGHVGWTAYLASSPDLIHWTKHGEVLAPGVAGDGRQDHGSASDLIIHKFDGYSGYYGTYLGTDNLGATSVPAPPYLLHGATAPAPQGPWTKTGILLPLGPPGAIDSGYNVDAVIFHRAADPAATFHMVYGAYDAGPPGKWTTALARSTTGPLGPYTKLGGIISGGSANQGVENPRIVDDGAGHFYLLNNLIDWLGVGPVTRSNVFYWSSQFDSYPAGNRSVLIEPGDQGSWDEFSVGVLSTPVIKDGMMYVGYDGGNYAGWTAPDSGTHKYRDGGFAEAAWPFPWAKAVSVGTGTAQTGVALPANSGDRLRIRVRLDETSAGFGLVGSTEAFRIRSVSDVDEWGDPIISFVLSVGGADVAMSPSVQNVGGHMRTWSFQRSGATLTIYCQGWPVWSGSSGQDLSLRLYGQASLDEAWLEQGEDVAEPIATTAATASFTFAASAQAEPTALGASAVEAAGQIVVAGVRVALGDAHVPASSSVTADGVRYGTGGALVPAVGSVTTAGERIGAGAAQVAPAGAVAASGLRFGLGDAAVAGAGEVAAVGFSFDPLSGPILVSGVGEIQVAGQRSATDGVAAVSGVAQLTTSGVRVGLGDVAIVGTGEVVAAPWDVPPTGAEQVSILFRVPAHPVLTFQVERPALTFRVTRVAITHGP